MDSDIEILEINKVSNNTDIIISHLSINNQYNTLTDAQGNLEWNFPNPNTKYYFFGFNGYSNAIINENGVENTVLKDVQYGWWTLRLTTSTGNQYITFGGGDPENINSIEDTHIVYNMVNGKLNHWEYYDRVSSDVVYTKNNEINIVSWDTSDGSMPPHLHCYINTPQEELLKLYLKLYLEGIDYILDREWETRIKYKWYEYRLIEKRYDNDTAILESLNGRTARELAIFRNYIFARHNYRFSSDEWNAFFRTYYKNDYNGTRTNADVMNILTEHEKYVLDLVVKQGNSK